MSFFWHVFIDTWQSFNPLAGLELESLKRPTGTAYLDLDFDTDERRARDSASKQFKACVTIDTIFFGR
ncbi:uncharacterized protein ARMOST_14879 [Armillaria ostoyae]|uniref:Uncharacterized protein n=1 Tax=Armillaria ostoyae TaxID=47428 RepID=A0A284RS17_ARMOS|nr:uncharacterized protein ARMOST_14879 [Armillaria ostoyae]